MNPAPETDSLVLGFIGFGEAASTFAGSLNRSRPACVHCHDIKSVQDHAAVQARAEPLAVIAQPTADALCRNCTVLWSLVTADQALPAARAAAESLRPGTLYLDGNSCSPGTKRAAAKEIEAAGGHYVDMAIMSPVLPARAGTPLLLSGTQAARACEQLNQLGLNAREETGPVGTASSIKMLRSVMVKGMEALFAECVLAARRAGVDTQVLGSLQQSTPAIDWAAQAAYNLERMTHHGKRRAAEMREVTVFL
ncbi:NAD(P)-dependent oxidoreductase [Natronospirillum operosum]|uniref:NAD(P)-dependent oxidoreductase n=1 Tax=Natronospirillum operosum TaxID=2759953 RepID=UPI00197B60D2|nr:DUF1932 domain-containing protein [Natronospirillum operosum]